jgi:hypothetical protein
MSCARRLWKTPQQGSSEDWQTKPPSICPLRESLGSALSTLNNMAIAMKSQAGEILDLRKIQAETMDSFSSVNKDVQDLQRDVPSQQCTKI